MTHRISIRKLLNARRKPALLCFLQAKQCGLSVSSLVFLLKPSFHLTVFIFHCLKEEKKKNYFSFSFKTKYIYFKLKQQTPVPLVPFLAEGSRAGLWCRLQEGEPDLAFVLPCLIACPHPQQMPLPVLTASPHPSLLPRCPSVPFYSGFLPFFPFPPLGFAALQSEEP